MSTKESPQSYIAIHGSDMCSLIIEASARSYVGSEVAIGEAKHHEFCGIFLTFYNSGLTLWYTLITIARSFTVARKTSALCV